MLTATFLERIYVIRAVSGASQVSISRGGLITVCARAGIEVLSLTSNLIGTIRNSFGPLSAVSGFVDWRGDPGLAGQAADGSVVVSDVGRFDTHFL